MTLTRRSLEEIADELQAAYPPEAADGYRPRYNVAPSDAHPIVRPAPGPTPPVLQMARWGLPRPPGERGAPHINARSETAAVKGTFRAAYDRRRCVVPADGFYEWDKAADGGRRPYWFHRADGALLLLAGLYEDVPGPSGAPQRRFVVLTTAANDLVAPIHDRMPVILPPEAVGPWLTVPARSLLRPAPAGWLVATPVSRRANSVKNDDPACLQPEAVGAQSGQQSLFRPI